MPTSFSRCVGFFFFGLCGLGGSGLRCGWFRIFGARGACGVATTPAVGAWMRRGEKGHPKSRKTEKHAGSMRKPTRLFEAHLGIFSGLVDQGLVARCFTVLQGGSVPA